MYILLAIFFISFVGIMTMIGLKLRRIPDLATLERKVTPPFVPDFQRLKILVIENSRKYMRLFVVEILRLYVKSSNFLKSQSIKALTALDNINKKENGNGETVEKVEVSKFLKMISDYKHKIKDIKHQIKEEEKNS